jgi:hypothetical protein
MSRLVRIAMGAMLVAALAAGSVASTAAGGPKLLDARMVGIPTGGLALDGVAGGGAPWRIDEGRAMLFADGRLHVEVQGLTLLSGVNPIATGRAIVTCASTTTGISAPVFSSAPVPFSGTGDAEVNVRADLPGTCLAPAVFFAGITANGDRWFAVTGF